MLATQSKGILRKENSDSQGSKKDFCSLEALQARREAQSKHEEDSQFQNMFFAFCVLHNNHFAVELQKSEAQFLILVAMPAHSVFCV